MATADELAMTLLTIAANRSGGDLDVEPLLTATFLQDLVDYGSKHLPPDAASAEQTWEVLNGYVIEVNAAVVAAAGALVRAYASATGATVQDVLARVRDRSIGL